MTVDDPTDDSDPALRGTVYALIVVVLLCAIGLAVGMVFGIG